VLLLLEHYLARAADAHGLPVPQLTPETIRTISGVFAPVVYRMPLMRPRPPASTARIALRTARIIRRLNTLVKRSCEDSCGGRTAPDRAVGARRL
jgi:hypothetical protein